MPARDELNIEVPNLGGANQGELQASGQMQQAQYVMNPKGSSSWGHSFLIFVLFGAISAMGYWGYDFLEDQQQRILLAEATEARIADLEQLLEDSRAQAEKSGQTLQQRLDEQMQLVETQKKVMDTQYLEYEKKFATLIESANEKQAMQLAQFNAEISKLEQKVKNVQEDAQEEMGFMTSQQKTALSGLEDRLVEIDSLRTGLTNLEIAQTKALGVQQGLVVDVEAITKDMVGTAEKSNLQLVELKKELTTLDSGLEKYKGSAHASLKSLTSKVSVLAKKAAPKLSSAVVARLNKTESAIRAFDGTRAQVNKDIQRLKSKVNKIQLQLQ